MKDIGVDSAGNKRKSPGEDDDGSARNKRRTGVFLTPFILKKMLIATTLDDGTEMSALQMLEVISSFYSQTDGV